MDSVVSPEKAAPWSTYKDWWDLTSSGSVRTWRNDGNAPSPFHEGEPAALRSLVPNGHDPATAVKIDLAHTYAICGWGKEELASTLVFLAVRRCVWQG